MCIGGFEHRARAVAGENALFGVIPSFTAVVRLDVLMEYIETQGMEKQWSCWR